MPATERERQGGGRERKGEWGNGRAGRATSHSASRRRPAPLDAGPNPQHFPSPSVLRDLNLNLNLTGTNQGKRDTDQHLCPTSHLVSHFDPVCAEGGRPMYEVGVSPHMSNGLPAVSNGLFPAEFRSCNLRVSASP